MGKILESFGVIDGYELMSLGKILTNKDEAFKEIEKFDEKIKEEAREIANNSSGLIYAVVKKNIIKGIYLFENKDKNLNLIKTVYTDEISEETKEKYTNFIKDQLVESVSMQEYKKVTFDDKVIEPNPKMSKKERILALLGGFVCGAAFGWMIFDEIIFGILYGIIFAPVFGGIDVIISNKRGRKKKENKEKKN